MDTIAIGTLGTDALAQITTAMSVFLVFAIGLYGFTSGTRILGAQAIGSGDGARFGTIVRSSIVIPLAIASGLFVAFVFGARPLMGLMLPPHVPIEGARNYLAIRMFCVVPMVVTGQMLAGFATAGDTKISLRTLVVVNLVHLPLLGVLALGFLTHRPLGLAGAALSSCIAECIACAYAARETAKRRDLQIFASPRIEGNLVRKTAALGLPDFVFLCLQLVSDPIAVALLAPEGARTIAALRALLITTDVTWVIPGSLGDAFQTIIGQRIGAGDYPGAREFLRKARAIALRISGIGAAAVVALGWPLSALFTFSPALATLAYGPLALHVGMTLPLKGLAMANVSPIRASGDTPWVMRMGIVTMLVSSAVLAGCVLVLHLGLWAFPIGFGAGWIYRNVATALRLRSGDWERRGMLS